MKFILGNFGDFVMNYSSIKKLFFICVLTIGFTTSFAQKPQYPQNYFQLPLNIPVSLSGTFSELRSNHFHSGIDFRTDGKIGLPVFSVAKGYVSRIKVSAWGGGKNLYITHPNGYKSVYMHLDRFEGDIAKYVETYQYANKTFEFDIDIEPNILKVEKGELVAKSGNTGGSSGPHLHFELRDSKNDRTINPLLFGYSIKDTVAPEINKIRIYPHNSSSFVNNESAVTTLSFSDLKTPTSKRVKKNQRVKQTSVKQKITDTILVWGDIYLGIQTTDVLNNSLGKRGVFKIELYFDGKSAYEYCITDFLFENTRFINAITDYEYYLKNNVFYILTKTPSIVPTEIVKTDSRRGIYNFTDEQVHKIQYNVSDYAGNTTYKTLYLKSKRPVVEREITMQVIDWLPSQKNTVKKPTFQVELEENTLYNSICFDYKIVKKRVEAYSDQYKISSEYIPLHKPFKLSLLPQNLPKNVKDKAIIVRNNSKGRRISEGGKWIGKMLVAEPKSFGIFEITIDSTAPKVTPINFKKNIPLRKSQTSLKIKITDNLSGIELYNCYWNGKWILAEYDGKSASLTINVKDKLQSQNVLRLVVSDACRNETIQEYTIQYK